MRGGKIVAIHPKYNGSNAFIEYIRQSKLSMLSYDSFYGLIIKAEYIGISSECPYLTSVGPTHEDAMRQMIVKLAIIGKENNEELTPFIMPDDPDKIQKYTMSRSSFKREIHTQFKLVRKTIQNYEPICPSIVYWNIKNEDYEYISTRIDEKDAQLKYMDAWIRSIIRSIKRTQVGIIGMELMDGYLPLSTYEIKSNFGDYFTCAIYELIRLGSLGYIHGDEHLNNMMYNPDVPYFSKTTLGRALLIDFGRTYRIDAHLRYKCKSMIQTGDMNHIDEILMNIMNPDHDVVQSYLKYIKKDLLTRLIIDRNKKINTDIQNPEYIIHANEYIAKYNRTINRKFRRLEDAVLLQKAPLHPIQQSMRTRFRSMTARLSNIYKNMSRNTRKIKYSFDRSNAPETIIM